MNAIYRIMAYSIATGLASYLPMIFHSEDQAYRFADHLSELEAFDGVAYAPIRVGH